jgi:hypothetical protein
MNIELETLYEKYGNGMDELWRKSDVGDLDDWLYDNWLVEDPAGTFRILKVEEFEYLLKNDLDFSNRWNKTLNV